MHMVEDKKTPRAPRRPSRNVSDLQELAARAAAGGGFSPTEFAQAEGLGISTVWKMIREGRLVPVKIGRLTVISQAERARWRSSLKPAGEAK